MTDKITTYKGFNKDWTCRGFQYEVGKTYTMDGPIMACKRGFHGCENPFDVWNYYDIADSKFAICTQFGETDCRDDRKIASASITVEAEIALPDFIKKCVEWLIDRAGAASGSYSMLAASGSYSRLAASGRNNVMDTVGRRGVVSGGPGSHIAIAEYKNGKCVGFATGCIGEDGLTPGVEYIAKNGKLVPK